MDAELRDRLAPGLTRLFCCYARARARVRDGANESLAEAKNLLGNREQQQRWRKVRLQAEAEGEGGGTSRSGISSNSTGKWQILFTSDFVFSLRLI